MARKSEGFLQAFCRLGGRSQQNCIILHSFLTKYTYGEVTLRSFVSKIFLISIFYVWPFNLFGGLTSFCIHSIFTLQRIFSRHNYWIKNTFALKNSFRIQILGNVWKKNLLSLKFGA